MEVLTNQNEGNLENLGVNENHRYFYKTTSVSPRGIPIPEKISIRHLGHASSVDALRLKIRGIFLLVIAWHHPGADFTAKWGLAPGWCPAVARTARQSKSNKIPGEVSQNLRTPYKATTNENHHASYLRPLKMF